MVFNSAKYGDKLRLTGTFYKFHKNTKQCAMKPNILVYETYVTKNNVCFSTLRLSYLRYKRVNGEYCLSFYMFKY